MKMRHPTISDAIDGGAYLDVDGEVLTIHQPHMTSDDPDAEHVTIVTAWPNPGMPDSSEKFRLEGTTSARTIAHELRKRGALNITPRWQEH
jgi:hypothetical protein